MGPAKKETNSKKWKGSITLDIADSACYFCRSTEDNENKLGKKYVKNGVCVHYFCMLFASGLSQRGRTDNDGILGFLLPDITKEAKRSGRLKCTYCKQPNATIGCVRPNCRACFHFGCGVDHGTLNQFFGNFSSFCAEHRPFQEVPLAEQREYTSKYTLCVICMSNVLAEPSVGSLRTSCCKANSWYHKDCLQRMATCSGLHFFKCPLCNNKDAFQKEMLDFGIYIPDRDAEWELEPNAFQELLVRHDKCDVNPCLCPHGPKYNEADTYWELILCDWCGHQGCHLRCGRLASPNEDWVCQQCIELTEIAQSPFLKSRLPQKKKKYRKPFKGGHKRKRPTNGDDPEMQKRIRLSESADPTSPIRSWGSPQTPRQNSEVCRGRLSLKKTPNTTPNGKGAPSGKTYVQRDLSYYMLGAGRPRPGPQPGDTPPVVTLASAGRSTSTPGPQEKTAHTAIRDVPDEKGQPKPSETDSREAPEKDLPCWLSGPLKEDAQADPRHGVKYVGFAQPCADHPSPDGKTSEPQQKRRRGRPMNSTSFSVSTDEGERPRWFKNLVKEDYITGRNLGRKLSAESPGLQLYPGSTCQLQSVTGAAPDGAHSDHQEGRASHLLPKQDASDGDSGEKDRPAETKDEKEAAPAEVADGRQAMGYFTFIQHLESIGYHRQHTVIERLSLYQQYKDGEFQLLTFADIKPDAEIIDNMCDDSPTPSLVSPNEVLDTTVGSESSPTSSREKTPAPTSASPSATTADVIPLTPNLAPTDMPGSPDIFDVDDTEQVNSENNLVGKKDSKPEGAHIGLHSVEHTDTAALDASSTNQTNHDHNGPQVESKDQPSDTAPLSTSEQTLPRVIPDRPMCETPVSEDSPRVPILDPTMVETTTSEGGSESDGSLPSLGHPDTHQSPTDALSDPETPSQQEPRQTITLPSAPEGPEHTPLPTSTIESSQGADKTDSPPPSQLPPRDVAEASGGGLVPESVPATITGQSVESERSGTIPQSHPVHPAPTVVAVDSDSEGPTTAGVTAEADKDTASPSLTPRDTVVSDVSDKAVLSETQGSANTSTVRENPTPVTQVPIGVSSEGQTTNPPTNTEISDNVDDSSDIDDADAELLSLPSEDTGDWSFAGNATSPDPEVSFRIKSSDADSPTSATVDRARPTVAASPAQTQVPGEPVGAQQVPARSTPDPEVSFRTTPGTTPTPAPEDDDDDLIITGSTPPDPDVVGRTAGRTGAPSDQAGRTAGQTVVQITELPTPTSVGGPAGRRTKVLSLTRAARHPKPSDDVIVLSPGGGSGADPSDKENTVLIELEEIPTVRPAEPMVDLTDDNNDVVIVELSCTDKRKRCHNCGLIKRKFNPLKTKHKEANNRNQHPPVVEID